MTDQNKGGLTVDLDASDLQHLIKNGASVVTKEIGPLEVRIRCNSKVVHRIDLVDSTGESTATLAEAESDGLEL